MLLYSILGIIAFPVFAVIWMFLANRILPVRDQPLSETDYKEERRQKRWGSRQGTQ